MQISRTRIPVSPAEGFPAADAVVRAVSRGVPTKPRHGRLVLGTLLSFSLITGCSGGQGGEPAQVPEAEVSDAPEGNPFEEADPPASDESRVEIPETDFTDARSVATSFGVAWGSYDGAADTDESYVDRYRPFVTENFLAEHESEGLPVPPQNLTAFRESDRLRTTEVDDLYVPETASESDMQVVLTMEGNQQDSDGEEEFEARPFSLTILVNNIGEGDPEWRVDRFLYQ